MPFIAQPTSNYCISVSDWQLYGCPVCQSGEKRGTTYISGMGTQVISCAHCQVTTLVCNDGIRQATIGVGEKFPLVQPHPCEGATRDKQ